MTLAAMAQTTITTPTVCSQNSIAGVRCVLRQLNEKIDGINRKVDGIADVLNARLPEPAPIKAISTESPTEPPRDTTTDKATLYTSDSIICKQTCEDEFNVCAKQAGGDISGYSVCKTNYESCFTKCGN